ncbi:RING finger protein 112, partial [Frankliniella fusca]
MSLTVLVVKGNLYSLDEANTFSLNLGPICNFKRKSLYTYLGSRRLRVRLVEELYECDGQRHNEAADQDVEHPGDVAQRQLVGVVLQTRDGRSAKRLVSSPFSPSSRTHRLICSRMGDLGGVPMPKPLLSRLGPTFIVSHGSRSFVYSFLGDSSSSAYLPRERRTRWMPSSYELTNTCLCESMNSHIRLYTVICDRCVAADRRSDP